MRYLGIDPGLRLTGYGCIELSPGRTEPALVEAGVLRLDARESIADRLVVLYTDLCELIERTTPDNLVVEKLYAHYAHPATAIKMGHARGVILLAGRTHEVRITELGATEVKKSTTGHGHATKRQIQTAIQARFGLADPPTPQDVADAIAIACTAADRSLASNLLT